MVVNNGEQKASHRCKRSLQCRRLLRVRECSLNVLLAKA